LGDFILLRGYNTLALCGGVGASGVASGVVQLHPRAIQAGLADRYPARKQAGFFIHFLEGYEKNPARNIVLGGIPTKGL
jgi:hypothetical protein